MKLVYRSLIVVLLAATLATLVVGGYAFTLRVRVACYDRAFYDTPTTNRDLVALVGSPHIVIHGVGHPSGIEEYYIYTSPQFIAPPVIWTFGVDASGTVVSRHRGANGC